MLLAIHQKYRNYTHGLLWFMKTDPRMPKKVREEMTSYGFCKDEWTDNDHWPWYLYIRAARRMVGPVVVTQHDITENRDKEDVIHIGSHYIDSHHITRYAYGKNSFINEGCIWQKGMIFDIPYHAITPKQGECDNLLVPVCVSSSAVTFCAIRLEPTWMHLGEASGIAASLAIKNQTAVQDIDVPTLQGMIRKKASLSRFQKKNSSSTGRAICSSKTVIQMIKIKICRTPCALISMMLISLSAYPASAQSGKNHPRRPKITILHLRSRAKVYLAMGNLKSAAMDADQVYREIEKTAKSLNMRMEDLELAQQLKDAIDIEKNKGK